MRGLGIRQKIVLGLENNAENRLRCILVHCRLIDGRNGVRSGHRRKDELPACGVPRHPTFDIGEFLDNDNYTCLKIIYIGDTQQITPTDRIRSSSVEELSLNCVAPLSASF
ncbi:hypothetical protein PsorP6_017896 [Peronosclerospora sorghi]|uniref:Uncharacterized protein n=1 Tax=Peronosclerospora sorghi TaxID=230839 RepID=A0ACC0WD90_9STRA|nr:hypothetical protein PsorP6_017896 [Peronosclerospora sorghi]